MKQIMSNGWRRVQARTALQYYKAGYTIAYSRPGTSNICYNRCYVNVGKRPWFWVVCTATLPARPANHAPAEKSTLAARINQAFKHAGHEAPIDYERVPAIPRQLLRKLWREIRDTQANTLIQQVANSVIM